MPYVLLAEITTINWISTGLGGTALALTIAQLVAARWRFRHPLMVQVEREWVRNPDGTQREGDHWRVRLLSHRERPITVHEVWWQFEDGSTLQTRPREQHDDEPLSLTLTDHAPVDLVYDLSRSSKAEQQARPRAAVAVDTQRRPHVGWVQRRKWWQPRRRPKRKVIISSRTFRAARDERTSPPGRATGG